MAKKTESPNGGQVDPDQAQPPLIPMSEAEIRTASRGLADKIRELEEMEEEHAEQREAMKADRDKLREEISAIASTIRKQGR